jgi:hypothetical protein
MVGYGCGGVEGRVLVFNPAETELRIKKGCRVAELHPGGKFSSRRSESAGAGVDNGTNGVNKRERASGVESKEDRSVRFPSCRPREDPTCAERSTDFPFLPPSGPPLETQQSNGIAFPEDRSMSVWL